MLQLGPEIYYQLGKINDQFSYNGAKSFSWGVAGSVGYRIDIDKKRSKHVGTVIGLHARYGIQNEYYSTLFIEDETDSISYSNIDYGSFYEFEAGLLIKQWFRISFGYGNQIFRVGTDKIKWNYYSSTIGFDIPIWNFDLGIQGSFLFGENLNEPIIRLNSLLVYRYCFGKFKRMNTKF